MGLQRQKVNGAQVDALLLSFMDKFITSALAGTG